MTPATNEDAKELWAANCPEMVALRLNFRKGGGHSYLEVQRANKVLAETCVIVSMGLYALLDPETALVPNHIPMMAFRQGILGQQFGWGLGGSASAAYSPTNPSPEAQEFVTNFVWDRLSMLRKAALKEGSATVWQTFQIPEIGLSCAQVWTRTPLTFCMMLRCEFDRNDWVRRIVGDGIVKGEREVQFPFTGR